MHLPIHHVFFILAIISGNVLAQGSSSSSSFSIVSRPSLGPGPITESSLPASVFPSTESSAPGTESTAASTVSVSPSGSTASAAPGTSTVSGASPTSTTPSSSATSATPSSSATSSTTPASGALSDKITNGPAVFMMMLPLVLYLGVL